MIDTALSEEARLGKPPKKIYFLNGRNIKGFFFAQRGALIALPFRK